MIDYSLEHMVAVIYASIEGREYTDLDSSAAGWQAWSYYAALGVWY